MRRWSGPGLAPCGNRTSQCSERNLAKVIAHWQLHPLSVCVCLDTINWCLVKDPTSTMKKYYSRKVVIMSTKTKVWKVAPHVWLLCIWLTISLCHYYAKAALNWTLSITFQFCILVIIELMDVLLLKVGCSSLVLPRLCCSNFCKAWINSRGLVEVCNGSCSKHSMLLSLL